MRCKRDGKGTRCSVLCEHTSVDSVVPLLAADHLLHLLQPNLVQISSSEPDFRFHLMEGADYQYYIRHYTSAAE